MAESWKVKSPCVIGCVGLKSCDAGFSADPAGAMQWINMRNREYWLSPERREETVDRLSSFAAQLMVPVMIGIFIPSFMMLFWLTRSFRLPS
jgi:hypothetical protein